MSNENEKTDKAKKQSFITKLKSIKPSDWIIVGVLCCVALLICFSTTDLFSFGNTSLTSSIKSSSAETSTTNITELESRLEGILSKIKGAGEVNVMITMDESLQSGAAQEVSSTSTAIVTTKVTGVVVVAKGASDTTVKLNIIRAVETLLDVSANDIEIFVGN